MLISVSPTRWIYCDRLIVPPSINISDDPTAVRFSSFMPYLTNEFSVLSIVDHVTMIVSTFSVIQRTNVQTNASVNVECNAERKRNYHQTRYELVPVGYEERWRLRVQRIKQTKSPNRESFWLCQDNLWCQCNDRSLVRVYLSLVFHSLTSFETKPTQWLVYLH